MESDGPRPRQARYQAALRPDICNKSILLHFWIFHLLALSALNKFSGQSETTIAFFMDSIHCPDSEKWPPFVC